MSASELAIQATASGVSRIYDDSQAMFGKAFELLNSQLLPALGKGVTITADYFQDLAGRYVAYLLTVSVFQLVLSVSALVLTVWYFLKRERNIDHNRCYVSEGDIAMRVMLTCLFLFFVACSLVNALDVFKLIFVPELRVYEELKNIYNSSRF